MTTPTHDALVLMQGLIIDEVIQIDSDVMRANLTDCSDMVLSKKDRVCCSLLLIFEMPATLLLLFEMSATLLLLFEMSVKVHVRGRTCETHTQNRHNSFDCCCFLLIRSCARRIARPLPRSSSTARPTPKVPSTVLCCKYLYDEGRAKI